MKKNTLPVDSILPRLVGDLRRGPAVVLQAPAGSGKTTRVPPALLDSGLLGDGMLVLLQPRRVAARACARLMASQRGEPVGETIGFQVRFERRASRKTRILVVTEGILTRRFNSDPLLEGISCVVLDEFHERSLHTDLALAFLRELLTIRDDLKVVVMSATIEVEPIARYLSDCPVRTVEHRPYPLHIDYLPASTKTSLPERCATALRLLFSNPRRDSGHVLVFLPGAPEIRAVKNHLEQKPWDARIMPLHGGLSAREQDAVLCPDRERRIILSTNIAETSLTIEGVTAVIDCGLRKIMIHDAGKGIDRLDTVRISRAGAVQRAGRAGRTGPGRVIRLWDRSLQAMMPEADPPEIAIADLASLLLQVLDFHGPDLDAFPFFERPPDQALARARTTLQLLAAIRDDGRITNKGKHLAGLPLHPRIACILERAASSGFLADGARICALLSESARGGKASFQQLLSRSGNGSDQRTDRRIREVERQLLAQARRLWSQPSRSHVPLTGSQTARLLLAGYPDRLCRVSSEGMGIMVGGRGVAFRSGGESFRFFLALDLLEVGSKRVAGKAGLVAPLTIEDVEAVLPLQRREAVLFDEDREAVSGVQQACYADLVLEEKSGVRVSSEVLARELARHAQSRFTDIFRPDRRATALLLRLRFAARHLPRESWPDFSDEALGSLLPQLCKGKRRFHELRALDWFHILTSRLDPALRPILDREVPERFRVPSGSMVAIDYAPAFQAAGYPVLAVRLQEMFGLADTPKVARGRVPLLIHLLAPNMRPCQVTRDLRNFWDTTYAEVRKELRRRYPKHAWPEDPWTAQPIRGARKKKKGAGSA